jgi:hypothetical protein
LGDVSSVVQKLQELVASCWSHDANARPEFIQIITVLEKVMDQLGPRKPSSGLEAGNRGCCNIQ